jgi:hypothetical protein
MNSITPADPALVIIEDDEEKKVEKRRTPYKLKRTEAGTSLNQAVDSMRLHYSTELNAKRNGPPFAQETLSKMEERVYCFLFFCRHHKNIDTLTLDVCNDDKMISEYVDYLSKTRKLMPNTITVHLSAIINVIKYLFRENWAALESNSAYSSCKSLQRQLSRQARMITKRNREGICTMKGSQQRFYFNHILDTIRNLRDKIFETSGIQKARHLHDFVMLATYLRVNPGRSKEIWTLEVFVESDGNEFDINKFLQSNVIVFKADNTVCLYECDFKTVRSAGPRVIDLSEDQELTYHLHKYHSARPTLLQAKSHSKFFVNYSGDPFRDSSSLCKYLGDLFEREVSIRVSTNALRHSVVSYFQSIEESKDIHIKQSLATLMKHSLRYQDHTYNDATQHEKTSKGRKLLRTTLAPDIFGEKDCVASSSEATVPADLDEYEHVLLPLVGDICALVDPASTAGNIHIFVAKVARYTSDHTEVHLIHLREVEGSNKLYRLAPGKVWKESVASLIYPIDVIYNASDKAYELRTSPEEIYRLLHNGK